MGGERCSRTKGSFRESEKWAEARMFGESAKADGVRYPPGQRIKSQKREKPRGSAVREAGRGRPEQKPRSASATSRLLRGRFFSSLHNNKAGETDATLLWREWRSIDPLRPLKYTIFIET